MGDNLDLSKLGGGRETHTIKSRVFVGNLPATGVDKNDLEDIFSKYGKILNINILRSFAFVQFDNESSGVEAIKNEAGRMFQNRKLDIKPALRGKQKSPERERGIRDRSPLDNNDDRRGSGRMDRGGLGPSPISRDKGEWRDPDRFDSSFATRSRPGVDEPYPSTEYPLGVRNGPFGDTKPSTTFDYAATPTASATLECTNDCEIIVVNKSVTWRPFNSTSLPPIREYAEFIERRLRKVGLTVDLLFPNEDVPLGRVLANISGRGSLYAIIITPQNEEHRSLTLNILHGQHQEHRNMPTEDAINLILRDFDQYMRGERGGISQLGSSSLEKHPEAVQTLLNLLQQNRQLTVLQYDKTIRYLQDRREVQLKIELGDTKDSNLGTDNQNMPPTKQAELQSRIMNILNKTTGSNSSDSPVASSKTSLPHWGGSPNMPIGQAPSTPSPGGPPPLLNDPTVQKALDNLMQGNLLKKINPGGPLPVPPPQPLFGAYGSGRKY